MISKIVFDAKIFVSELLKSLEKEGFGFHNLSHTIEVFDRATYLCHKEGFNDDLIELVQLGAIFHDTGFVETFYKNEENGVAIFQRWIEKAYPDYPFDRIELIKNIILATKVDIPPQNKLEEIIKDADIDSLGRDDFFDKAELLRQEYKKLGGKIYTEPEWVKRNYDLFNLVKFYTNTAIQERSSKYNENFNKLNKLLK